MVIFHSFFKDLFCFFIGTGEEFSHLQFWLAMTEYILLHRMSFPLSLLATYHLIISVCWSLSHQIRFLINDYLLNENKCITWRSDYNFLWGIWIQKHHIEGIQMNFQEFLCWLSRYSETLFQVKKIDRLKISRFVYQTLFWSLARWKLDD